MTDYLTQLSTSPDGRLVCTGLDYIEFDIRLARDGSCPTTTKAAYMALAGFANMEQRVTLSAEAVADWSEEVRHALLPYRKTIAACMGRSVWTFDRAAADLEERNFLVVEAQSDPGNPAVSEANLYRLTDRERWARQLLERAAGRTPGQLEGPDGRPLPRVLRDPGIDYIKLDARIVCIGDRSPNYKAVYAAVASFANMNSRAITQRPPTLKELMACTGLGRTAVTEALAQMRKDGLLETTANFLPAGEGGGKTASSYFLLDARLWRRRAAAREDAELTSFAGGSVHQPDGGPCTTRTGVRAPAGPGSVHQPDDITRSSTRRGDERLPDARRAGTGGLARVPRTSSAASQTKPGSGSAATSTRKPRTKTIRTSRSKPVAGEEEVFAVIDALNVSKHPALRVPPLRKAVRTLLSAGRTPEHAQARINEGWWRAGVPEKILSGEIRGPVGYLAAILATQDCQRPDCERGIILQSGEECRACDLRAVERQAERARRRLEQDTAAVAATESAGQEEMPVFKPIAHPVTWRCEAPGPDGFASGPCGRPGRGTAPALRMCPDCLETVQRALTGR